MDDLTATLLSLPSLKVIHPTVMMEVVTVAITAFGETREAEASVSRNEDGSVRLYHTRGLDFVARVGSSGLKSYPISATLWPIGGGSAVGSPLKLDLRGFVLRRSVVASAWRDQATQVTTRIGWMS